MTFYNSIVIGCNRHGSAESGNPYSDYDLSDYYLHSRDDGYSAPSGSYGAPSDSYGVSGDSYGAPSYGYSSDEPDYGVMMLTLSKCRINKQWLLPKYNRDIIYSLTEFSFF